MNDHGEPTPFEWAYLAGFTVSLCLAGLTERFGAVWLLPLGITLAVGAMYAVFSRRY